MRTLTHFIIVPDWDRGGEQVPFPSDLRGAVDRLGKSLRKASSIQKVLHNSKDPKNHLLDLSPMLCDKSLLKPGEISEAFRDRASGKVAQRKMIRSPLDAYDLDCT